MEQDSRPAQSGCKASILTTLVSRHSTGRPRGSCWGPAKPGRPRSLAALAAVCNRLPQSGRQSSPCPLLLEAKSKCLLGCLFGTSGKWWEIIISGISAGVQVTRERWVAGEGDFKKSERIAQQAPARFELATPGLQDQCSNP